jgi:hypothetical protein
MLFRPLKAGFDHGIKDRCSDAPTLFSEVSIASIPEIGGSRCDFWIEGATSAEKTD